MNEPRPTTISARPWDTRSSVANSWNTRTGSAALSTVTALVRRIRRVRAAAGSEEHRWSRVEVLLAVMFSDPEGVKPDAFRVLDLLDQVTHALGRADRDA